MPAKRRTETNRVSRAALTLLHVLAVVLFAHLLTLLSNENLPDYEAYFLLYELGGELGGRYLGFGRFLSQIKDLGLTYEMFRMLTLYLGIFLSFTFLRFQPQNKSGAADLIERRKKRRLLFLILLFVVILEFYLIRLRGGMSIFFFCFGFLAILKGHRFRVRSAIRSILILLSFYMSASIHMETFLCLSALLFPPLAYRGIAKTHTYLKIEYLFFACLAIWLIVFWKGLSGSASIRGEHLSSQLNFIRFLSLSIFPIMIWLPVWAYYRKNYSSSLRSDYFPYLFGVSYIASAIALLFFYISGAGSNVGEAIVRVVTLSSVGAAITVSGWGLRISNALPVYLMACNSLFFINTVYL